MTTIIDDLYETAIDAAPYAYQRRIALDGLPELLEVPTGCGKTPAMLLGWLFRRRFHPNAAVRAATPRRLLWCLPMRTLVDQATELASEWLRRLGLGDEVPVYQLLGGEPTRDSEWRRALDGDCVVVGTLDMLLSRALNRGYLASRFSWPIDFAIVNNDCHWVFDEVQLMDVALATSRQLHGLRTALGLALPTGSTWMSATVDREALATVDAPSIATSVALTSDDVSPALAARLDAPKLLLRREVDDLGKYPRGFADIVAAEHRPGTRTIAVVNTVDAAREVYAALRKATDFDVVLVHSRFRPGDRAAALERVLAKDGGAEIVVSTQVIEAGVDVSSATLVTECAPWSSIVQRAGRCNRWGEISDSGRLVVVTPSRNHPYEPRHVDDAWAQCGALHGTTVTPKILAAIAVDERRSPSAVLRRSDLLELFDTAPDLSGNDVDVSRFIRVDGQIDLAVAWREFDPRTGPPDNSRLPSRAEQCRVALNAARKWLERHEYRDVWVPDVLATGTGTARSRHGWRRATRDDVRAGAVVLAPLHLGGYSAELGFDPSISAAVSEIMVDDEDPSPLADADVAMDDDPLSIEQPATLTLAQHLLDVEGAARVLCDQLAFADDPAAHAVVRAGRLHDLGKAHPVWQRAIRKVAETGDDTPPLAKSGKSGRLHYDVDRRGFRHELASALALIAEPSLAESATNVDADLVIYLVGAHHGRVRVTIPMLANEDAEHVLGVKDGDSLDEVDLGDGESSAACELSLDVTRLGNGADGERSWTARSLALLDHHGPFRLAWLETLVRIADWRASSSEYALTRSGHGQ
jgi:CRISPR-associated endonuclease/helicase Cas3